MGLLAYLKTQFELHLLIGFVFVVSGLVINFIQLCTLVLWPLNKQLYHQLNCCLAFSLWSREYLKAPLGVLLLTGECAQMLNPHSSLGRASGISTTDLGPAVVAAL
ncbi:1-acyl-sn-glycerol-3-phosphate acyltransferase gamma [Myotis davidii]|uniref:1-acyl-sn-glycerol-3-phosphate acyltransferase gamma n=1 Tax=Myotis davidii TaxID=225400 RepID=L5M6D3_MYODS|nr:1-acyl-sn-glycerol-3-phosphate acyltransferase gamma [Myotis davidii]